MFRCVVVAAVSAAITAASPALAAELNVRPLDEKYDTLVYTAYPGEANNVNVQALTDGTTCCLVGDGTNAVVWADLGSPVIRSRNLQCVNSVFSALCVMPWTTTEAEIDLGDRDDRVDVSGAQRVLYLRVSCGSGVDKVVASLRAPPSIGGDCEHITWVQ